ncbi:Anhydromuropeptide permease [Bdellovibrio bacteriovorus]|uniref:AmpG family muropeptide MFS transporter n=1 Tax=Bdellovibrio bacteriovorus TaxID=959 RepID=UPI00045C014C|nr:MFS transporter [Bdellovibrio bacteriovorus]AHZ85968.1 beta-lactamase [Bdellovibrio bacteriovorus]BEV66889.1 Anhydromuropeptide permease [Bdellovibrio bacteriovorus]
MTTEKKSRRLSWMDTIKSLARPKVSIMLALGFSSGLPFMLVGNTLGYWLRESGIALATIGFLSWVGLAYSLKFVWAPLIDKMNAPIFGAWLGRRRGWMIISQILVGICLFAMAYIKPEGGLALFTLLAAIAAFASATQDIVVDAWRIEVSDASEDMALLSSSYQLGYRASLLVTDALILILAGAIGWSVSYSAMGALMAVGVIATLFAAEPKHGPASVPGAVSLWSARGLFDAVAGPFIAFFKQHASRAILILAAVCLYRLSDFVMGPMANPFYADLGLTKETVGAVRGSVGLIASVVGVAAAGLTAVRFGFISTLLIGAVIGPASNLGFSVLAMVGPSTEVFTGAMIVDNFATGFAGTALVGYMSSLTTLGYTATQYALLSSFYALLGKVLKGFSGLVVQKLNETHALMESYAMFFLGTALIGVPALLLCILLVRSNTKLKSSTN